MSTKDDGEPAFPRTYNERDYDPGFIPGGHNGMSLRQWYAGMALQGILSRSDLAPTVTVSELANEAFQCADAMIEESKK